METFGALGLFRMIHNECGNVLKTGQPGPLSASQRHLVRLRFRPSAWYVTPRERLSVWAPRARAASPLRPPNPRATDLNCREWWRVTGERCFRWNGWQCPHLQKLQERVLEPKCLENTFKTIKFWNTFGLAFSGNIDVGINHQASGSLTITTQKSNMFWHLLPLWFLKLPSWPANASMIMHDLRQEPWSCVLFLWDSHPSHQHFSSFQAILWLAIAIVYYSHGCYRFKASLLLFSKGQSAEEPLGKFLAILLMSTPWKLSSKTEHSSSSLFKLFNVQVGPGNHSSKSNIILNLRSQSLQNCLLISTKIKRLKLKHVNTENYSQINIYHIIINIIHCITSHM